MDLIRVLGVDRTCLRLCHALAAGVAMASEGVVCRPAESVTSGLETRWCDVMRLRRTSDLERIKCTVKTRETGEPHRDGMSGGGLGFAKTTAGPEIIFEKVLLDFKKGEE